MLAGDCCELPAEQLLVYNEAPAERNNNNNNNNYYYYYYYYGC
jgi:hypothetical protein